MKEEQNINLGFQSLEHCIKAESDLINTKYHNICTGEVNVVPTGVVDYIFGIGLILFALLFQYAADSTFLYKTINESWYAADISEYLFVVSYFLMTIAFIQFLSALEKFKKSD